MMIKAHCRKYLQQCIAAYYQVLCTVHNSVCCAVTRLAVQEACSDQHHSKHYVTVMFMTATMPLGDRTVSAPL
jgi:hypothetical protein